MTWLTGHLNLYKAELARIEYKFDAELTNNSLWTYRKYLAHHLEVEDNEEFEYVTAKLAKDLKNESAWLYLDSIYEKKGAYSDKL